MDALNQIGQTEETKDLGDDEQYKLVYSRLNQLKEEVIEAFKEKHASVLNKHCMTSMDLALTNYAAEYQNSYAVCDELSKFHNLMQEMHVVIKHSLIKRNPLYS